MAWEKIVTSKFGVVETKNGYGIASVIITENGNEVIRGTGTYDEEKDKVRLLFNPQKSGDILFKKDGTVAVWKS